MGQGSWERHLEQVETLMKGLPFWKTALFGVQCLRRLEPVYERLCVGREWGNARGMHRVVERFYQAIPTGYAIGGRYLAIIEDSAVVPTEDWDVLAAEYVENAEQLLEAFEGKDKKAGRGLAERNLEFLYTYLDFEATGYTGLHPLMAAEMDFQRQLAEELRGVENRDKRDFVQRCRETAVASILQDAWFRDYPDYKPVRRKKAGPGSDGLRFRTAHQIACVKDRDYNLCWESDARRFQALEDYRASPYYGAPPMETLPPALEGTSIGVHMFAKGKYRDFYESICFRYSARAQELYLKGADMGEVLKALHQAGESAILSTRLWRAEGRQGDRPYWGYQHTGVYYAMLIYRYDEAEQMIRDGETAYARLLWHLLTGDRSGAEVLLPQCKEEADGIYRGTDCRMAEALCTGDASAIRAAAVKYLRAIRAMESLYCEVFPMPLILSLRAAASAGHAVRPIEVSELPAALLCVESPFEAATDRPFGAELVERALP